MHIQEHLFLKKPIYDLEFSFSTLRSSCGIPIGGDINVVANCTGNILLSQVNSG